MEKDFINYTINWVKGEMFEGAIIVLFGMLMLLCSFLFWKTGTTPNAKALVIPIAIVSILLSAAGASLYFSNQKRLDEYQVKYQQDPAGFAVSEKKRVEDFQYLYPVSVVISAVCFLFTVGFIGFSENKTLHAAAVALMLLGGSGVVIDYFSKERAKIYYDHILSELRGH